MNELASFAAEGTDDVIVGALSGEVDLSNAAELERATADAVPNSARGLVLDLSAVSYIDSSGVRLVLSLAGSLRWRGQPGHLRLRTRPSLILDHHPPCLFMKRH